MHDDPIPSAAHPTGDAHLTRASLFNRIKSPERPDRDTAWAEFRDRYTPIIASFAKRCGASRQDIDDIVQDVMTGFFSISKDFAYDPDKGRFRGWLKTCTVRAAIRRAGKNLRYQGVPLETLPEAELAVEPMWNDIWEQQLVAQALAIIRDESPDSLAFQAFEQYVLLDRPAAEVARELGISLDQVYQSKTRITRQLRETVQRIREREE